MKNLFITGLLCLGPMFLIAQTTAEEYLSQLPAAPKNVCSMTGEQKTAFLDWVGLTLDKLEKDIANRRDMAEAIMDSRKEEMQAGSMQQAGLSEEDIEKMKNAETMNEEDKKDMADQMLQKQMNMSMAEIDKLKGMTESGRKAWAEAYSAEMMANTMANPQQQNEKSEKIQKELELLNEQNFLRQKLQQDENVYLAQFDSLEQAANEALKELALKIKPLQEQLKLINDGEGSTQADADAARMIIQQIHALQDKYCIEFTPRYIEILVLYKKYVQSAIPDINRFEIIQSKVIESQSALLTPLNLPLILSCSKVLEYGRFLKSAFKYKLYTPDGN